MKKRDKKQLLPGIVVAAAISFLVFLYAPVDLYCSNISEFWFDFGILIRASLGLFLISTVVLLLIYIVLWLIHPVLYRLGLAGGFLGLICTYIQGKFSDQESAAPGWNDDSMGRIYISEDRGFYSLGHRLCCCSAHVYFPEKRSFVQNGNVFKRWIDIDAADHSSQYCIYQWCTAGKVHYQYGADEQFVMSEDQNFVILLLDTVDSRTITELLDEHPEYSEVFRDFTYFENTVGAYSCTERSVPYILSGDWYENDEPFDDYGKRVYQESPLFQTLQERGYNMELCDSELYMDTELMHMFSNIHVVDFELSSYTKFAKPLLKLIGFRYAPFELKKMCTFKKAAFAELLQVENTPEETSCSEADHVFKSQLDLQGITVENSSKNSNLFI